jgi:thioester reductase-like protein
VLTGSTGALGSYLLDALIKRESVSTIYCLNRSADAEQRQVKSNASRGLITEWDSHQVKFLASDYSLPDLGLGQDMYSDIAANASLILHNAWQVDFNISLDSYESHVRGVRHLLDSCLNSAHQAKNLLPFEYCERDELVSEP